jgi:hypothetical protein
LRKVRAPHQAGHGIMIIIIIIIIIIGWTAPCLAGRCPAAYLQCITTTSPLLVMRA